MVVNDDEVSVDELMLGETLCQRGRNIIITSMRLALNE
jgi:hypothetical protein